MSMQVSGAHSRVDLHIATAAPGIDPQTLSKALQAEIARVKTEEPITGDEFDRALNGWKVLHGRLETVNGPASTLQLYNYYLGTPDGLATDLARYTSLSALHFSTKQLRPLTPHSAKQSSLRQPRKRSHNETRKSPFISLFLAFGQSATLMSQ